MPDIKAWSEAHREEIRVGAAMAAVAFFFTQGLPLWNDDYNQWLAQADSGLLEILKRIILPVTAEPQTWGYSDRPVQILMYRILSWVFGTWGTGYFLVKSVAFGALGGALYSWMRGRLGVAKVPACLALACLALSANTVGALVFHSDFAVYSQLAFVLILGWSIDRIEKGPQTAAVYKKGWGGLPKPFRNFLLAFIAAVYLGAKLRGDVRLVPLVLLAYLAVYRRERLKVYAAPFAVAFLATLPYSADFFRKLPPFLGGAGYSGWTYVPFSLKRVFDALLGDAFLIRGVPLSLVGGLGVLLAAAALGYLAWRAVQEKLEAPGPAIGLPLAWLAFAALACGMVSSQNPTFMVRYAFLLAVPATLLVGALFQALFRELGPAAEAKGAAPGIPWVRPAVYTLVAVQCGLSFMHAHAHRRDLGRTQVAVDRIHRTVEERYPAAGFVYLPGFIPYGYKAVPGSTALAERKAVGSIDELAKLKPGATYAASWGSTLDVRLSADTFASGCASSLFDAIFPCGPADGAFLLRFNGAVPEVGQAEQLAAQGNVAGAKEILEAYVKRDPGNHGALFILSLYAYKLRDYPRMEQIYDQIGPHFGGLPSVVYNWGLAKQGVEKFREASKHLEAAYRLVPKDYAIGFNLADSYYRQGRKGRALAMLDELIQAFPNDQAIKNARTDWSKN